MELQLKLMRDKAFLHVGDLLCKINKHLREKQKINNRDYNYDYEDLKEESISLNLKSTKNINVSQLCSTITQAGYSIMKLELRTDYKITSSPQKFHEYMAIKGFVPNKDKLNQDEELIED